MFSTLPEINLNCSVIFILSSANVFNLDQSKILSFGEDLTPQHKENSGLYKLKAVNNSDVQSDTLID